MATRTLYPSIAPSLDLNFAGSKTLDPRITFSRASAATYYDGKTVAKAEENLLLRSQEFDQAPWEKLFTGAALAPVVTANAGTAPDGTVTADRVVFSLNGGVSSGDISQLVQTLTLSGQYVFSVWLRSADGSSTYNMQLAGAGAVADVAVNGSWQRFTVTGTYAGAYSNQLRLRGAQGIVNSNTADVLVWGAQLEQRSQVTAYTPTTTQPITNYIPVLQTALAGVPRFDHNPVTGESLGLLVEEQRTNFLTYSEQFDNAAFGKDAVTVSINAVVAPDGILTADKLVENTAVGIHRITGGGALSPISGTTYTVSIYAKAGERRYLMANWNSAFNARSTFDLQTGTIASTFSGTATITNVGNGWYRCTVTGTATVSGSGTGYFQINNSNASSDTSYAGDGLSGVYIWGAQLEAGAFPTSYIKTEASQVTRAADSASMTGANFSSWYRQDEGTIAVESILRSIISTDAYVASIQGANIDNTIRLGHLTNGNARRLNVRANAVNTVALDILPASVSDVVYKQSASYKVNDFATSSNGSNVAKIAAGAIPYNLDKLVIGASALYVRRIAYYPKRLADAQLQALTL